MTTVDANEVKKFHVQAAHWWDVQGPFQTLHHINPVRVELIQSYGGVAEQAILDVGCGGGILSEALATLGAHVVGVDADTASIETARQHAQLTQTAVTYYAGTLDTLPMTTGFDRVVCCEMLEHVSDPQTIITQCARHLKPGGYLFLSTMHRTWQAYFSAVVMAEYVLKLLPRQTHDYEKFIRPSELAAMSRAAGLDVVQLIGMGYNPLTKKAALQSSVNVNYFMVCRACV